MQGLDSRIVRFSLTLAGILALLVFNGWFLYYNFERIKGHQRWIAHTWEVINELDQVRTSIVDTESRQRAYMLTLEDRFLNAGNGAGSELDMHLKRLEALTADSFEQSKNSVELKRLVKARLAILDRAVEQTIKKGKFEITQAKLEEGWRLSDELNDHLNVMKQKERALLVERERSMNAARLLFYGTLFFTTLLSIVAVTIAGRLIRRNQERLEKEAAERDSVARVRESLSTAANTVTGALSPEALSQQIQEYLASVLGILASKIYMFNSGRLVLVSAFGTEGGTGDARKRSLVDEAITRSEPWWIDDVPTDYWKISSGLGEATPRKLVFLPLSFQGRRIGVIEMALFRDVTPEDREVIAKLPEILSIGVSAAISRDELQQLLEKSQQQAEELEAQQEELKANNEELEQQARALESQQQSLNIKNRELEETRRDLEAKALDLQLSTQYKSDFLAKMSHELRTPLNGLLILSTLLIENKEKNLNEQQRQFARSINSAGNDLLVLINDILDLSKIEARKLAIKPEAFALGTLFDSVRLTFGPQAQAKNLDLQVVVDDELRKTELFTDRQRLEQILRNFLSNALKFTEKGSIRVEAKLHAGGQTIEIGVKDSGIGIPREKQELIFEAFEQADGSVSRKFGGTGLGLTISRELAALLGGEIRLDSKDGEGSRFSIVIPTRLNTPEAAAAAASKTSTRAPRSKDTVTTQPMFAREPAAVVAATKAHEQAATAALAQLKPGKRSILIVEDDVRFSDSIVEAATGYGFEPIVAHDGETAIAILERHTPDAILLDIKLPGISGLGLLEMVKHMPQLRHIPVHMISGMDYQHNALRMGALGYLTKPVTMEKVRSALGRIEAMVSEHVRRILLIEDDERQSGAVASLIAGQDVEIDPVKSGREALARLRDKQYDCVILDLTLPDISGFEMLEELNKLEISVPPIVIYTGKDLTDKEEEYLRKYSESIIIKGARSPERLLDEVNLFLHRVESLLPLEKREMLSQLRSQKDNFDGKTVLVVDDDLRNVFALTSALETKNLNVKIAKDGVEALEVLASDPEIDLVLMDIMMPRMDGFEAMRRIRRHDDPRVRGLPVVALTAKAMREDHEKCIEAGASDYIPKPVDLNHLTTILKVWLAPKGIFA